MKRIEKIENLSYVLIKSRESKNKSQRWMAKALCKSPTTISNWEDGISIPDIIELIEWFDVLGMNPTQYMLELFNPCFLNIKNYNDDMQNKNNLIEFISNVATPEIRKKLAFNLLCDTGSFFEAQLELLTAHNLCGLDVRVNNAWQIYHHYVMAKERNELVKHDIVLNNELLHTYIMKGETAAFSGKSGYSTLIL